MARVRVKVRVRARARAKVWAWVWAGARGRVRVALDGLAQLHRAPVRFEQVGRHGDEHGGRLRDVPWDVLDLVEAEPVEEGLVRHRGEGVVPAEHDVLGVGDLVREKNVEGLGAPVPLELHLRRLPGGRLVRGRGRVRVRVRVG